MLFSLIVYLCIFSRFILELTYYQQVSYVYFNRYKKEISSFLFYDIFLLTLFCYNSSLSTVLLLFYLFIKIIKFYNIRVKLKFTKRIYRFLFISIYTFLVLHLLKLDFVIYSNFLFFYLVIFQSFFIEYIISYHYIKKAKYVLNNYKGIIIGLTGSYGKTTTKHYLQQFLSNKFSVLITPRSYNTILGISKVINEELDNSYEIFIVEMGASKKNDISKLMNFISLDLSILTNIGDQHLETFKSLENIASEKIKIVNNLPRDSFAFVNSLGVKDDLHLIRNSNVFLYGDESDNLYFINNITDDYFEFKVILEGKELFTANIEKTSLYTISNIMNALAVALYFDIDLDYLIQSINNLREVNNRFKKFSYDNLDVFDNSFNSNLKGAIDNIKHISTLEGKKIIVTCGFVDLDFLSYESHVELGMFIMEYFDYAYIVKTVYNKDLISLFEEFDFEYSIVKNTIVGLKEAKKLFNSKTIILIENDVADVYER